METSKSQECHQGKTSHVATLLMSTMTKAATNCEDLSVCKKLKGDTGRAGVPSTVSCVVQGEWRGYSRRLSRELTRTLSSTADAVSPASPSPHSSVSIYNSA